LVSAPELLAAASRGDCRPYLQIQKLLYGIARSLPIYGKTMLRRDTKALRYAGQPVFRHGRASACGVGVYSNIAPLPQGRLPA
jgi:hypothetical protein